MCLSNYFELPSFTLKSCIVYKYGLKIIKLTLNKSFTSEMSVT